MQKNWLFFLDFDQIMARDMVLSSMQVVGFTVQPQTELGCFNAITGMGPYPNRYIIYIDCEQITSARDWLRNTLDLPPKDDLIWSESTETLEEWAANPTEYGEWASAWAWKILLSRSMD
jgi:hypothetical protein